MHRSFVSAAAGLGFLLGITTSAGADERTVVGEPPGLDANDIDEDCATPEPSQAVAQPPAPPLPHGRAVSGLTPAACRALLDELGVEVEDASAEGGPVRAIEQPVRLRGSLGGLTVRPHGGDPGSIHAILDCRLVVALYEWGPTLRAAGFVGIEHVSVFRPGARVAATGHVSGHSHALAIDALRFVRPDGTSFSVLDDWVARTRGADPCGTYDEPAEAHALRQAICAGAAAELFEVIVTPHHDDAHRNHVHLEVLPGVDWTALR
jgi:hypothetical protein